MHFNKPEINFDAIDFGEMVIVTSGGGGQTDYCTGGQGTLKTEGDSDPCTNGELLD